MSSIRDIPFESISEAMEQFMDDTVESNHMKRVAKISKALAAGYEGIDIPLLRRAAIVHDVAKKYGGKGHRKPKKICKALKKMYPKISECSDIKNFAGIISAHAGEFSPPEGYIMESAILRVADKIDKYQKAKDKEKSKAEKNGKKLIKKSIRKIQDYAEDKKIGTDFVNQLETSAKDKLSEIVWKQTE